MPNYGERYRNGERIASGFVESAINQVVSKRMVKKQQMGWSQRGAHLLLQIRTRVLDEEWENTFRRWYPDFRPRAQAKKGVRTRKCANCPAREAAAMLARSAIRAGTRFSRCHGGGEGGSVKKSSVSRSESDNQAHAFTLERRLNALRGVCQPLNRREFTLNALNCPI